MSRSGASSAGAPIALLLGGVLDVGLLALLGLTASFVVALVLLVMWALRLRRRDAAAPGLRQRPDPVEQRATVLSFDSLMGSAGGVVAQPGLGRVADVNGYAASYLVSAGVQALAIPFVVLARRENASSDPITDDDRDRPALRHVADRGRQD